MSTLEWSDYLVIALYFVIVLGIGMWATCRANTDNASGYFLAGRSMTWIPIGASTFSTNVGAPMFVGIAGTAAASGVSVVMFEWHAMFMLLLLGWLFLPVYMSSGCYTMPEYLRMRYGGQRIRIWLAILAQFLSIISEIAGQMYAGSLFIQMIFDWDLYTAVTLILLLTAAYTIMGGLTAVMWTDTIQTGILIVGCTILAAMSLVQVGGFESMQQQYMQAAANYVVYDEANFGNHSCGMPREDAFHIFRDLDSDYPWFGMIFGLTILATNAWCTNQICVQRSLSAKTMSHAKAGVILAAYLKITPFLFFLIPGMVSRIFYPEEVACADPDQCRDICGNAEGCSDIAYPLLVIRVMPPGVRGIMLAALLSALMSSLTSIFNSTSTIFTMDIWKKMRPRAKEAELMIVGRLYTLMMVGVSIAWLPILEEVKGSQFWDYSQQIGSFIIPPVVVVFLLGLFWTRTTEQGAFWGLVIGLVIGVVRMGLEWSRSAPPCGSSEENNQFAVVSSIHYLHFAVILAAAVAIFIVAVSIMTEPRPPAKLRRVTFWTRNDPCLPELTDDEDEEEEEEEDKHHQMDRDEDEAERQGESKTQWMLRKVCGVTPPKEKLTKAEMTELRLKLTDISEDKKWKKILGFNAILCAAVSVFIHAFWA